MKLPDMKEAILWLFVINLGISLGAGLYESRIELPEWLVVAADSGRSFWDADAAREANTGLRFWVYVTTVPLTLLIFASFIAAWHCTGPVRHWWLGAAAVELVTRIMTFAYFIPVMITLSSGSVAQADAVPMAQQWVNLNLIRHALGIVALVAALKAFSLFYATRS